MSELYRQLVLCPEDKDWKAESVAVWLSALREAGLIDARVNETSHDRYLIGEKFLQHFSFMGCSPAIEFAPLDTQEPNWHQFVFVHLPETRSSPLWLADRQMSRPACPDCQKRYSGWAKNFRDTMTELLCSHCGNTSALCEWDWKDAGGCACQFIFITNVFPREAIPSDNFLQLLGRKTGIAWRYFYIEAALLE